MAAPKNKKYDLASIIERELKKSRTFPVAVDGGKSFDLPPRVLWPDEAIIAAKDGDIPTVGRLLLGEKAYAEFTASTITIGDVAYPCTSMMLLSAVEEVLGASLPE
jgi:hypothetical protein